MYNHFQTFQPQTLYGMIIKIKDELNYNINPVCFGFVLNIRHSKEIRLARLKLD